MADRVRIVAKGPLGAGTEVHLIDPETGEGREFSAPIRSIQINPITPDGTLTALLDVSVDELDVTAELLKNDPPHVVKVEPGDVVVVSLQSQLRPDSRVHISELLERQFPSNRVLVLDGGVRLQIVRGAAVLPPGDGEAHTDEGRPA